MTVADATTGARHPVRPFYWSVRRELWEHRALWGAPLSIAAVILVGFLLSLTGLHGHASFDRSETTVSRTATFERRTVVNQDGSTTTIQTPIASSHVVKIQGPPPTPAQKRAAAALPFDIIAVVMLIAMFLVAWFYCLGALHNERRDRSILFWRSLPVTDRVAVAAKAVVPLAILPAIVLVVTVGLQALLMGLNLAYDAAVGRDTATLLSVPLGEIVVVLAYGLVALSLWWAPVYAWLLLVSVWARRAPFLWAVLPPLAIAVAEKVGFDTHYVGDALISRLSGCFDEAFVTPLPGTGHSGQIPTIGVAQIDIGKYLSTPALWIGLVVAAVFLAATVWLRRRRDPI